MGRLSLAIGRHKENNDGRNSSGSKSKHLKSSLKGLLGISGSDRASVDLGDIGDLSEEGSFSRHSAAKPRSIVPPTELPPTAATENPRITAAHTPFMPMLSRGTTAPTTQAAGELMPLPSAVPPRVSTSVYSRPSTSAGFAAAECSSRDDGSSTPALSVRSGKSNTSGLPSRLARLSIDKPVINFLTDSKQSPQRAAKGAAERPPTSSATVHDSAATEHTAAALSPVGSSLLPLHVADLDHERAALERYSLSMERSSALQRQQKDKNEDKSSWRRRGSILGSRLAGPLRTSGSHGTRANNDGGRQMLARKESTPLFSFHTTTKQHSHQSHLFKRSDSSDALNRTAFWRSGSTLRGSVSTHEEQPALPFTDAPTNAALITHDRSQRSSSVPFFTPVPNGMARSPAQPSSSSTAGKSHGSPYLKAVGSGLDTSFAGVNGGSSGSNGRLNRKDLSMSFLGSGQSYDRFPKPAAAGIDSNSSPPGSGSPISFSIPTDRSSGAPLTFLVSARPRSNTGSKHEITATSHSLSKAVTRSRDFGVGKRNLSSTAIAALTANPPASARNLPGSVDMSEFGVSSGAVAVASVPESAAASGKSMPLPPSPVSTGTPARSIAGTSVSAAFEPLHEEPEGDEENDGGLLEQRADSDDVSEAPAAGALDEASNGDDDDGDDEQDACEAADAVHETHHMAVDYDPHTGRKMINQYMIIRELGRGTHGKVKLAFDTITGEYYAIKIIDKESRDKRLRPNARMLGGSKARRSGAAPYSPQSPRQGTRQKSSHGYLRIDVGKMEKVKREIAILKKCRHPNVVRLREVIDDAHARRIYLVIEYMDGGEILWRDENNLPVMSADEARRVFRDLVLGVEYLHYVGILHRDLKPQNLLHNKAGTVKISDFGVSFLSRRMSKRNLKDGNGAKGKAAAAAGAESLAGGSAIPSFKLTLATPDRHMSGNRNLSPALVADGKSPSPLRPAGSAAAFQGSHLHRYASQPLMNSPVLFASGPVLQRKGSVLMRSSRHGSTSSGSPEISSPLRQQQQADAPLSPLGLQRPFSQSIRRQATMGMTNEFGLRKASLPAATRVPESPLGSPADRPGTLPVYKLPPELSSTDSNVYDPFDSSDSDEFFTSSDSESDYGGDGDQYEDNGGDSDASDSEDGIVFGASPSTNKDRGAAAATSRSDDDDAKVPATAGDSEAAGGRPRSEARGTLGEIDVEYDEKDEERELAKTAGTPAFFAPELCCTAEELAKMLKDERARRQARAKLVARQRNNTDPQPALAVQRRSSTQPLGLAGEGESSSRSSSGVRPASLFVENSASPFRHSTPLSIDSSRHQQHRMKRHSTIASLLAKPFSMARSSPVMASSSTSGTMTPLVRVEDAAAGCGKEEENEPLPANVITPAIDIWAMGVTLYCLIYGRVPFKASTEFELFNIIPRKPLEFPQFLEVAEDGDNELLAFDPSATTSPGAGLSEEHSPASASARRIPLPPLDPDLRDLLARLLDKDFRTRITIEEIKTHPWVVKGLDRPSSWAKETDPTRRPSVNITSQEVEQAMVPKVRQRGFRASVRRRISMFSPRGSRHQQQQHQQQQQKPQNTSAKTKSSLDWLKIWH